MGIARADPAAVDNLHRQPIAPNGSRKKPLGPHRLR